MRNLLKLQTTEENDTNWSHATNKHIGKLKRKKRDNYKYNLKIFEHKPHDFDTLHLHINQPSFHIDYLHIQNHICI